MPSITLNRQCINYLWALINMHVTFGTKAVYFSSTPVMDFFSEHWSKLVPCFTVFLHISLNWRVCEFLSGFFFSGWDVYFHWGMRSSRALDLFLMECLHPSLTYLSFIFSTHISPSLLASECFHTPVHFFIGNENWGKNEKNWDIGNE